MTRTVTVVLQTTDTTFAAGTVAGQFSLQVVSATTGQPLVTPIQDSTTFVIPDVPADTYNFIASRLDASGAPLGASFTTLGFVVADADTPPPAGVTVALPSAMTITLS